MCNAVRVYDHECDTRAHSLACAADIRSQSEPAPAARTLNFVPPLVVALSSVTARRHAGDCVTCRRTSARTAGPCSLNASRSGSGVHAQPERHLRARLGLCSAYQWLRLHGRSVVKRPSSAGGCCLLPRHPRAATPTPVAHSILARPITAPGALR